MSLSHSKKPNRSQNLQTKKGVKDNIILWLNRGQYDRILNVLQHDFSDDVFYSVQDLVSHLLTHFNEIREEFIHSVECIMECNIHNDTVKIENHLKDLNKLKSLIYILKNIIVLLSHKVEAAIDTDTILNNPTTTKHYKLINTNCRSFEYFHRYVAIVTILFGRIASLRHEALFVKSVEFGFFNNLSNLFNNVWKKYAKTKTLHISCFIDKLNKELAQFENYDDKNDVDKNDVNKKDNPNRYDFEYFSYPPKNLNDILKLTLVDTPTVDLPKIIFMYLLYDLNSFYNNKLLTSKMMQEIVQANGGLNLSFVPVVKQLWLVDKGLPDNLNYMCIFPSLNSVVLYEEQHLTTLKSFITDNFVAKAINFADKFNMETMPFEFNSLVVGLMCNGGLYFRLIPIIQTKSELPEYWHIIIHFSNEIGSLFIYLINAFFMLDSINIPFIWQFIEHFISLHKHIKLLHQFVNYSRAYQYILYICNKTDELSNEDQYMAKSLFSNYCVKFNTPLTLTNALNNPTNNFKNLNCSIEFNKNPIKEDSYLSDSLNSPTTIRLPVQSLNESLGLSMWSSLINKSVEYQSKNIANRLHYSLNNSFQPTSILKTKSTDTNASIATRTRHNLTQNNSSNVNLSNVISSSKSKKLRFIIDGVVLSSGRDENTHNLNDTFDVSNETTTIYSSFSDEGEFFDAVEYHQDDNLKDDINITQTITSISSPLKSSNLAQKTTLISSNLISSPYINNNNFTNTNTNLRSNRLFDEHSPILIDSENYSRPFLDNVSDNSSQLFLDALSDNSSNPFIKNTNSDNSSKSFLDNATTNFSDKFDNSSKPFLDIVTTNLSDKFDNLSTEDERLSNTPPHNYASEINEANLNNTFTVETQSIVSTTASLPLPSINIESNINVSGSSISGHINLKESNLQESDLQKGNLQENDLNNSQDSDEKITIRKSHRVKHIPAHLIELNEPKDDSPYNSVIERRSFSSDTAKNPHEGYFNITLNEQSASQLKNVTQHILVIENISDEKVINERVFQENDVDEQIKTTIISSNTTFDLDQGVSNNAGSHSDEKVIEERVSGEKVIEENDFDEQIKTTIISSNTTFDLDQGVSNNADSQRDEKLVEERVSGEKVIEENDFDEQIKTTIISSNTTFDLDQGVSNNAGSQRDEKFVCENVFDDRVSRVNISDSNISISTTVLKTPEMRLMSKGEEGVNYLENLDNSLISKALPKIPKRPLRGKSQSKRVTKNVVKDVAKNVAKGVAENVVRNVTKGVSELSLKEDETANVSNTMRLRNRNIDINLENSLNKHYSLTKSKSPKISNKHTVINDVNISVDKVTEEIAMSTISSPKIIQSTMSVIKSKAKVNKSIVKVNESTVKVAKATMRVAKSTMKVNASIAKVNESRLKDTKSTAKVNKTKAKMTESAMKVAKSKLKGVKSTAKTDESITKINESSVKGTKSTVKVNESTAKINKSTAKVTKAAVKVNKSKLKGIKSTAKIDESITKINESTAKVTKAAVKVNESKLKGIKSTAKMDESITKINESRVKCTKSTAKVNKTKAKMTESAMKVAKSMLKGIKSTAKIDESITKINELRVKGTKSTVKVNESTAKINKKYTVKATVKVNESTMEVIKPIMKDIESTLKVTKRTKTMKPPPGKKNKLISDVNNQDFVEPTSKKNDNLTPLTTSLRSRNIPKK